jgi:hypothetical protein
MAKAKATPETVGFEIPEGAKVFLGLLVQAAAQALLDWLTRKGMDLQSQAQSQAAAVTVQKPADAAAEASQA